MPKISDLILAGINTSTRKARRQWRAHERIKRTKRHFAKNDLLRRSPSTDFYEKRVQAFWLEHFGRRINPIWHLAIAAVTGAEDERYIPQNIWFDQILPYFNDMRMRRAYLDKNLARSLINPSSEVVSILKFIHGAYYTNDGKPLSATEVDLLIRSREGDVILKRADTDNGEGVHLATLVDGKLVLGGREMTLREIEAEFGRNFAVQPRVRQHPVLALPHPESLNTVRILTFRWDNTIQPLLSFVRMGVGGSITDNAGTGGLCRGIESCGQLSDHAIDAYGMVYAAHPSTGYEFGEQELLPGYQQLLEYAKNLHERVFHFNLVSWDFFISEAADPVFLEMNFLGASYVYQFACRRPIFGDLTQEVLAKVKKKRE